MKAKEYLQQIKKCDKLIENKLSEIKSLYDLTTSITTGLKEDVVQSSGVTDKIGDTVSKIIDLQQEINDDIDSFVDLKREIMSVIDRIDDVNLIDILYKRYFKYETWERIATEMNFTYQWVCKLHGRALQKVQQLIEVDI